MSSNPLQDIRIGTMVNCAGLNPIPYMEKLMPYGFECFSLSWWKTAKSTNLKKLAKEVKALLDTYVNSCVQESTIFQEYYKKFCTILPPSKVVRLYQTEEEFRRILLEWLRYYGRQ